MNFLAGRKRPAIPQNDPKMGSFGSFRAVRGLALLPNIKPFIPLLLPASCCGALRPKTPIKNGYFWVFLADFWAFKIGVLNGIINPLPRYFGGQQPGILAPGGRPLGGRNC